jgi:hypothetical protein
MVQGFVNVAPSERKGNEIGEMAKSTGKVYEGIQWFPRVGWSDWNTADVSC